MKFSGALLRFPVTESTMRATKRRTIAVTAQDAEIVSTKLFLAMPQCRI
jgi:hypothetical protein